MEMKGKENREIEEGIIRGKGRIEIKGEAK